MGAKPSTPSDTGSGFFGFNIFGKKKPELEDPAAPQGPQGQGQIPPAAPQGPPGQGQIPPAPPAAIGGGHQVIVVKLYMNGCPACEGYKPEWNKLVKEYKSNAHVKFFSFEQKKIEEGLLKKFNAKYGSKIPDPNAFPTLYIFSSSNPSKVHTLESREPEAVKKWIEKMSTHHSKGGAKTHKNKDRKNKTQKNYKK